MVCFRWSFLDSQACTKLTKKAFARDLCLDTERPIFLSIAKFDTIQIDWLKCKSNLKTYYQLDLSALHFPVGTRVSLKKTKTPNVLRLKLVPPACALNFRIDFFKY
jgi:hypothetical protein